MIESIVLQDITGTTPPFTLLAPRDEATNTSRISVVPGLGIQLCKSKGNASASIHVSQNTLAFEPFREGIRIEPPISAESGISTSKGCKGVCVPPSKATCIRMIYLRHGDKVVFSDLCTISVGISLVTEGSIDQRDPSVVQVGSSIPDKGDGNIAKVDNSSVEAPMSAGDSFHQSAAGSYLSNKIITETPRRKRNYDALADVDDSYVGAYVSDVDLDGIYREEDKALLERSPALLDETNKNAPQGNEEQAFSITTEPVIEVAHVTQKQSQADESGGDFLNYEVDVENEVPVVTSPANSEESIGQKRKRGKVTTYSKLAKNKRARRSYSGERVLTESKQTNSQDVKSSQSSTGRGASREDSKDAATPAHRTRGGKPGYAGNAPKVMFSNSAITENGMVMKFFTSHGCKRVDQVGKPFDLLVVGQGELRKRSKLIMAVAQGKPVVTDEWLEQSVKAGRLLDTSDFAPRDPEREKEWGWRAYAAPNDAQTDILIGRTVYMTPALKKEYHCTGGYKDIEEIAKAAGAKRVLSKAAREILKQDADNSAIVLGKDADDADCVALMAQGHSCFSRDFLPMSILRGELQFDDASLRIDEPAKHGESVAAQSPDSGKTPKSRKRSANRKLM